MNTGPPLNKECTQQQLDVEKHFLFAAIHANKFVLSFTGEKNELTRVVLIILFKNKQIGIHLGFKTKVYMEVKPDDF